MNTVTSLVTQPRILDTIYPGKPIVHFANTSDATSGTPSYDKLLHIMAARFQGVLRAQDYILFHEEVVPHQRKLAAYQRAAGISQLPDDHILGVPGPLARRLSDNFENLNPADIQQFRKITEPVRQQGGVFLPYIQSQGSARAAKKLNLPTDASGSTGDKLNNKVWVKGAVAEYNRRSGFRAISQPLGQRVLSAEAAPALFRELKKVADRDVHSDGSVWIKLACSGGGNGVKRLRSEADLATWLELPHVKKAFASQDIYSGVLMDIGVKARKFDFSPSANLFVGKTRAEDKLLLSSSQLFGDAENKEWVGNIGPLSPNDADHIKQQLEHIFDFLRSHNAFGFCGIDFIVAEDNTVHLIEVNYRITGAMAAGFIALERGAEVFVAANEISVPWGTTIDEVVDHWDDEGILWNPGRSYGVFATNALTALGLGNEHPVIQGGIIAGSREEALDFLNRASLKSRRGANAANSIYSGAQTFLS